MLGNYLKIAFRNVRRNKLYSFINVVGLATGIACAVLIFLWVRNETSFDDFFKDAASIYRVNWNYKWNGNEGVGPTTPPPLAGKLTEEVPEIAATVRIYPAPPVVGRYESKLFNEHRVFGVDSNFFDFFSFRLMAGDRRTVLATPNSVVLTATTARRYFGDESPIGKMLELGDKRWEINRLYDNLFVVTGVVEDPPENSHLQFDLLTSMSSYPSVSFFHWSWIWMQMVTYARVRDPAAIPVVEAKVKTIVAKYAPAAFQRVGFSFDDLIKNGGRWDFAFQPLNDVYLGSSQIGNSLGPIGNRSYVVAFSLIAVFILLIACVNFMNLSTAQAEKRAKEVGVRKSLGSTRGSLFAQFTIESVVFSFLALPIAFFFVELFSGPFEGLVGKAIHFQVLDPLWQIPALLCLTVCVGILAGSYPGVYLSSIRPVQIFRDAKGGGIAGRRLRGFLTVFQFAIGIGLIVCTLLVHRQVRFVSNADLGFNKEGLVVISNINNPLGNRLDAFRQNVSALPHVIDATIATGVPPNGGFGDYYKVPGKGDEQMLLFSYMVDENFIPTLGITLDAGRNFRKEDPSDANGVVLNETAVKQFEIRDPIGKTIDYPSKGKYTIIGVMKDFNFFDLHAPVMPFGLFHRSSKSYAIPASYVLVRLTGQDLASNIASLEAAWKECTDKTPFEFSFLDQDLAQQYSSERTLADIFLVFSVLAILIGALGLLGLASFVTERRTKEIGVRRILGASAAQIVLLLSKEFSKWVLLANVVAWPLAYYVMDRWLENFAYRTNIGIGLFLLSGVTALAVALLTVSAHAIKAATANPVEALRYE